MRKKSTAMAIHGFRPKICLVPQSVSMYLQQRLPCRQAPPDCIFLLQSPQLWVFLLHFPWWSWTLAWNWQWMIFLHSPLPSLSWFCKPRCHICAFTWFIWTFNHIFCHFLFFSLQCPSQRSQASQRSCSLYLILHFALSVVAALNGEIRTKHNGQKVGAPWIYVVP